MREQMLGVFKLHPSVKVPQKETEGAACFDLRLCLDHVDTVAFHDADNKKIKVPFDGNKDRLVIAPGERVLAPTGIIFEIPEGYSLRLHSRSSMSWKLGLRLGNSEGIIDSDYFHETFVMLHNTSNLGVSISNGERICQAELVRSQSLNIGEITKQPSQTTDRTGGFGSTGEK